MGNFQNKPSSATLSSSKGEEEIAHDDASSATPTPFMSPHFTLNCSICRYAIPIELRILISSYYQVILDDISIRDAVSMWFRDQPQAFHSYGHISEWNTTFVTDMHSLFRYRNEFNENINHWDASNVVDMSALFHSCHSFNQPLNQWDVSYVQSMNSLFYDCQSFNQPLNAWDVSNVRDFHHTFKGCVVFNQPLHTWIPGL